MNELDSNDKVLLQRAYAKLQAANEVMRFLSEYFGDKYGLTPAHQITPNGIFVESTLSGLSGVSTEKNGRVSESDDMWTMQGKVAVSGKTHGDT